MTGTSSWSDGEEIESEVKVDLRKDMTLAEDKDKSEQQSKAKIVEKSEDVEDRKIAKSKTMHDDSSSSWSEEEDETKLNLKQNSVLGKVTRQLSKTDVVETSGIVEARERKKSESKYNDSSSSSSDKEDETEVKTNSRKNVAEGETETNQLIETKADEMSEVVESSKNEVMKIKSEDDSSSWSDEEDKETVMSANRKGGTMARTNDDVADDNVDLVDKNRSKTIELDRVMLMICHPATMKSILK